MSKGNSVLVTAMFCKRCERSGFDRNERGKPLLWTGHAGHYDCSRLRPHFFFVVLLKSLMTVVKSVSDGLKLLIGPSLDSERLRV